MALSSPTRTTALAQLTRADDMVSLRDRLLNTTARRVIFVLPPDVELLGQGVNLALLRRLADREQVEVGLVTLDRNVRRQAVALGLPVFESTRAAERSERRWRPLPRREKLGFAPGDNRGSPRPVAKP